MVQDDEAWRGQDVSSNGRGSVSRAPDL